MSTPRTSFNNQMTSYSEQARQTWERLVEPHPSVTGIGEFRRVQLLSTLALILSVIFIGIPFLYPSVVGLFFALGGITFVSYILGRTKYYRIGCYIVTYTFTALAYLRIYQGIAPSVESSIASTVPIALMISSVLLSQRGFLSLAILTTLATFTAPLYSHSPFIEAESINRTGGAMLMIGAILYGIQIFRANLDNERAKELTDANHKIEDLTTNLEQRVGERTVELEQTNRQVQERFARLQSISEISQEITSNIDQQPKELLNRIARSISEKLGYYHVGIFLIDENREFAVLRAANSEGGQRMLNRQHQLKVGGTGIVGYVSQGGRARIALDTGSDAVFFNNPDLPETRSEIALPIKYGSTIIGVLDVQSTLPSTFKDEDTNLFDTLTSQIAIAVSTVLVHERARFGMSLQSTNRGGERHPEGQQLQSGYSYLPDGTISTALSASNTAVDQAVASGEIVILTQPSNGDPSTLAVPVKFRDQVIGIIHIEATEANRKWTDDEVAMIQSISDRAAFALENARLFEETARRADQEETIARVTTQIGASTDFNRILQTTVQELGRVLGASRSFIQLSTPPEKENGNEAGQDTPVNTVN